MDVIRGRRNGLLFERVIVRRGMLPNISRLVCRPDSLVVMETGAASRHARLLPLAGLSIFVIACRRTGGTHEK